MDPVGDGAHFSVTGVEQQYSRQQALGRQQPKNNDSSRQFPAFRASLM
jgi:hypothetical protein